MKLLPNARAVLLRAWSVRLLLLATGFQVAEVTLPLVKEAMPVAPGIFAILSAIATGGAFIARFVVQKKLSGGDE